MRPTILRSRFVWIAVTSCFLFLWPQSAARSAFTDQRVSWLNSAGMNGISASLGDMDNDGDLDLLFLGSGSSAQLLFRNNTINIGGTAAHSFTNVTSTMWQSAPANVTSFWSAAWGDYDGDGKVDIFVGENNNDMPTGRLMRNTGSGFTDVSVATGLNDNGFHQNVAWADVNNDHLLDMVIGMEGPEPNQIYLQDATHHFTAVGATVGIQTPVATKAYGMAIGDADGDGDLDIYISTCTGNGSGSIAKAYYKNNFVESGTGTLSFTDASYSNGTQNVSQGYGAEFADFDNDGKLDLWVVGSDTRATKIYKNMGNGQFTDVDTITGGTLLSNTGTDFNGGKAVDYDNDGKLDLFFHDHLNGTTNVSLYHNDSNPNAANPADRWKFTLVTTAAGISSTGLGAYDGVWGDIDLDGDMDLINPNNSSNSERVYINDAANVTGANHWLFVRLHGPVWDSTGIGSSIYAVLNSGTANAVTLRREANTNAGTFNQSDLPVQFGLGAATSVDLLLVRWPDGTAQGFLNVPANQYLAVNYLPGDYNGDSTVDGKDYVMWRKYIGSLFTTDDYNTWRAHFGQSLIPGAGAAVPEPAASLLIGVASSLLLATRRRWH
jgi:enediyne biosynthesis protein E4